jgi:hypothetical protein
MKDYEWNEDFGTQKSNVRAWLLKGNMLTPLDALRMFGSLRLSAIIFRLREEGLPIVTEKLQVSPRKRVAQYYLPKDYLDSLTNNKN